MSDLTAQDKAWINHLVTTQCQIIYTKDFWSSGDIAKQIVEFRKYFEDYMRHRGEAEYV